MKKFIALVVVLCAVMISSSTASASANWVWIYSDEYCTIYVDNNSIRRDYNYRGYVFRAFVKWIYSDAGRNRRIKNYRSAGLSLPKGMYNLSHDVVLEYFKAENGMKYSCTMDCVCYDKNGNTIPEMNFSKNQFEWRILPPDSIGEWIFDMVRARVPN